MSEWKECKLSDLGEIVGGATPSTRVKSYYENGTIPWITPKDLSNFKERYIYYGARNITKSGLDSCSAQMLPKNSILFSSRAPIGYVAIAGQPVSTNQGFKSIIPNQNTDGIFLYYLMCTMKSKIEQLGSGTTFKEVSGKTMKNVMVKVPTDINEQKRIGQILSNYDSLIEINEAINKNLEELAEIIFYNFFFQTNPPKAWKIDSLSNIADYLNGLAMQKYRPINLSESLPVLKIKELRQGYCDASSDLCSNNIKAQYIVNSGDVIFSWSGTLIVDFWCNKPCGLNQHLFKVTSNNYDKWFYYSWTKYHLKHFISKAADKATTMGHIKRRDLDDAEVFIPTNNEYIYIGKKLEPIYDMIILNRLKINQLNNIKSKLLSTLFSI